MPATVPPLLRCAVWRVGASTALSNLRWPPALGVLHAESWNVPPALPCEQDTFVAFASFGHGSSPQPGKVRAVVRK